MNMLKYFSVIPIGYCMTISLNAMVFIRLGVWGRFNKFPHYKISLNVIFDIFGSFVRPSIHPFIRMSPIWVSIITINYTFAQTTHFSIAYVIMKGKITNTNGNYAIMAMVVLETHFSVWDKICLFFKFPRC